MYFLRVPYNFFVKRDCFCSRESFCVFVIRNYPSVKRELLDVNVNVKKFKELFVTREKGKYFYVKTFCQGV